MYKYNNKLYTMKRKYLNNYQNKKVFIIPMKRQCLASYWKKNHNNIINNNILRNQYIIIDDDDINMIEKNNILQNNYICVIHDDDINICSIYECQGFSSHPKCNHPNYIS